MLGRRRRGGLTQTVEVNGRGEGGDEIGISNRLGDVLGSAVEAKLLREVKQHPAKVDHLAIIMDGNRRFAWSKALETDIGHKMGKNEIGTSVRLGSRIRNPLLHRIRIIH